MGKWGEHLLKIENINGGETYKYKELCNLLDVKYETATNRKVELLEEFERYFSYERVGNNRFFIKEIYNEPLPGIESFFYKTIIIPVKCSDKDYQYLIQCNKWSAQCWNALVAKDKLFYDENSC